MATACAWTPCALAAKPDTVLLKEVEVQASRNPLRVYNDGTFAFDTAVLAGMPRTLGESDALSYLKLLPGVNTFSDYSSGVSIDGMSYAHNAYLLNGIPVHFPYHFGGFFSTFNPVLYPRVRIAKGVMPEATQSEVIGGTIEAWSRPAPPLRTHAVINVGMIASSIAAEIPLGSKFTIGAAARISYLNLFYSGMLGNKNTDIRYDFHDADFFASWRPDSANTITATAHYNADVLNYEHKQNTLLTSLHWHNALGNICWRAKHRRYQMEHNIYISSFANALIADIGNIGIRADNTFASAAITGKFDIPAAKKWHILAGYKAERYRSEPQNTSAWGIPSISQGRARQHQYATLTSANSGASFTHGPWHFAAAMHACTYFGPNHYRTTTADPSASATYSAADWSVSLSGGRASQFIHQVGFSEIGMASNFKLCATGIAPVERLYNLALHGTRTLPFGLTAAADVFFKKIHNEADYISTILEMTSHDYSPFNYLHAYNGHNIGGSAMLSYLHPAFDLTGSYSYCRALRRNPADGTSFTATTELRHCAKITALWRINSHWEAGGVFVLNSGRPYTPINAFYVISNRVMLQYGKRNSATMPAYHRLDLNFSYKFNSGQRHRLSHRIELGIINAYARANVEAFSYYYKAEPNVFRRRTVSSLARALPTLSYTLSF